MTPTPLSEPFLERWGVPGGLECMPTPRRELLCKKAKVSSVGADRLRREVHHGEQDEERVSQQREVSEAERVTKEIDVEEKEKREEEAREVGDGHSTSQTVTTSQDKIR
eukprot:scaffold2708_cov158-Ochromonas_danica.AAC.43